MLPVARADDAALVTSRSGSALRPTFRLAYVAARERLSFGCWDALLVQVAPAPAILVAAAVGTAQGVAAAGDRDGWEPLNVSQIVIETERRILHVQRDVAICGAALIGARGRRLAPGRARVCRLVMPFERDAHHVGVTDGLTAAGGVSARDGEDLITAAARTTFVRGVVVRVCLANELIVFSACAVDCGGLVVRGPVASRL